MAIVKGTFSTNLTGRVGSVVYRNRSGKNIATQIPASVKNPQSVLQQQQRMKFNSVVQAYKCLKSIVDHSFEGVSYGAPSQAKFLKDNVLAYTLTGAKHGFIAKGNGSIPMGNFKIAEGSLPQITFGIEDDGANPDNIVEAHKTHIVFPTQIAGGTGDVSKVTVAQLLAVLGISKGDQFTIMAVQSRAVQYFGTNSTIPQCTETTLLKSSYTIAIDAPDSTIAFVSATGGYQINPTILTDSENVGNFYFGETAQFELIAMVDDALANLYAQIAYGVVASRRVGSTWQRSTQTLQVCPSTIWIGKEPETIPEYNPVFVVETYNPQSSYYLNNENSIL